jgi:hypothetical protein
MSAEMLFVEAVIEDVVSVATGALHTCVLVGGSTNQVKCIGDNSYGELGQGSSIVGIGNSTTDVGNHLPYINLGAGRTV